VKELALAVLRDEKAHLLVRTGGAQSCGRMALTEAAPELRKLAESPQTEISLRTVAIAGLGQLNDEESRPLLMKLSGSPVPGTRSTAIMSPPARSGDTIKGDHVPERIRQAAQMALQRLDAAKAKTPAAP
jgi:hypothetical protein